MMFWRCDPSAAAVCSPSDGSMVSASPDVFIATRIVKVAVRRAFAGHSCVKGVDLRGDEMYLSNFLPTPKKSSQEARVNVFRMGSAHVAGDKTSNRELVLMVNFGSSNCTHDKEPATTAIVDGFLLGGVLLQWHHLILFIRSP